MKDFKNLLALAAALALTGFIAGCGDDDDSNNNNNNNNPPPQTVAPTTQAALMNANSVYTVNVAGQAQALTLTFPANGQYMTSQGGTVENGTITGLQRNGNTWTGTITPNAGQQGAQSGQLQLTFATANSGTYTFTPANGGATRTGNFNVTTLQNPGGGGGNTNTNQNPNPPGNTSDLTGKTLQFFYPATNGGEKFQFTSPTQASYENGADTATYTYDPATHQFNATRGGGQTYQATLNFNAGSTTAGNTAVQFRQDANSTPQTDNATFTLQ